MRWLEAGIGSEGLVERRKRTGSGKFGLEERWLEFRSKDLGCGSISMALWTEPKNGIFGVNGGRGLFWGLVEPNARAGSRGCTASESRAQNSRGSYQSPQS